MRPSDIEKEIAATEKLIARIIEFWDRIPIFEKESLRKKLCKILDFIYFEHDGIYRAIRGIRDGDISSINDLTSYKSDWFRAAPEVLENVEYINELNSNFLDQNEKQKLFYIGRRKSQLRHEINNIWYDAQFFSNIDNTKENSKIIINMIELNNASIDRFRSILECAVSASKSG